MVPHPRLAILDDAGFLLSRASGAAIRATNLYLRETAIRARHFAVLSVSCDTGGISQRDLAGVVRLDPSQVVSLVDDLQRRGWVERRPDARDRRTRLVAPTSAGLAALAQARRQVDAAVEELFAPLDEAERTVLLDLLRKIGNEDVDGPGRHEAGG